jgi:hypothetical protein
MTTLRGWARPPTQGAPTYAGSGASAGNDVAVVASTHPPTGADGATGTGTGTGAGTGTGTGTGAASAVSAIAYASKASVGGLPGGVPPASPAPGTITGATSAVVVEDAVVGGAGTGTGAAAAGAKAKRHACLSASTRSSLSVLSYGVQARRYKIPQRERGDTEGERDQGRETVRHKHTQAHTSTFAYTHKDRRARTHTGVQWV